MWIGDSQHIFEKGRGKTRKNISASRAPFFYRIGYMFAFCPHQLPLLAMPVSCFDVLVLILSTAVYACLFHFTMTAPLWNYRILRVLFYSLWFPLGIGIGEEHVGGLIGMCFECVSYTNSLTNLLTTIPLRVRGTNSNVGC